MLARIALAAAALALTGWSAYGLRTEQRLDAGRLINLAASRDRVDPALVRSTLQSLDDVARVRTGAEPYLQAAGIAGKSGDDRRAERYLRAALRREPESFVAWRGLAALLARRDPEGARRAAARARALNPLAHR